MPEPTVPPTELHFCQTDLGPNRNGDGWANAKDVTWIKQDFEISDETMAFIRRKAPPIEFFAYEQIGAALPGAIPPQLLRASF